MTVKRNLPDFSMLASVGKIKGVTPLFKFGRNTDIDTGTAPEDIISGGGTKLFPTTDSTLSIVSTSANDTTAGTGINTIRIEGLDINFELISEDVVLNGLTPVITTGSYCRVHRMYGTLSGSLQAAGGVITVTHSAGIITEIEVGNGQSQDCTYTVPSGYIFLIERLLASLERTASGAGSELHFEIKSFGSNTWRAQATLSIAAAGTSFMERSTDMWFPVQEKTDIRVRAIQVATNNTSIAASFEGFLINLAEFTW